MILLSLATPTTLAAAHSALLTDAAPLLAGLQQGLLLVALISLPLALAGLAATLLIGLLQSASQLHDQTISAVPRMIAMYAAAAAAGLWALRLLIDFASRIIAQHLH